MVTDDTQTRDGACAEEPGLELNQWVAGPAAEAVRWDVFEERPELRKALRAVGYDGEFWFEVRPLTESEEEQRITASRYLERESEQLTFDEHRHWRFTFVRQIQGFRLPVQRSDGTYIEVAGGGRREDIPVLYTLGRAIMAALKRKLREVNGELPAQRRVVRQVKKC